MAAHPNFRRAAGTSPWCRPDQRIATGAVTPMSPRIGPGGARPRSRTPPRVRAATVPGIVPHARSNTAAQVALMERRWSRPDASGDEGHLDVGGVVPGGDATGPTGASLSRSVACRAQGCRHMTDERPRRRRADHRRRIPRRPPANSLPTGGPATGPGGPRPRRGHDAGAGIVPLAVRRPGDVGDARRGRHPRRVQPQRLRRAGRLAAGGHFTGRPRPPVPAVLAGRWRPALGGATAHPRRP